MDFSQETEQHLESLSNAMRQSDLVLVIGAGVSVDAGSPNWDELLRRLTYRMLMIEAGELDEDPDPEEMRELFRHFRRRSPLILARYLRHYFGESFREEVRKALYHSLSPDQTTPLMEEIANLARASGVGSRLNSVVTYNFDDLLEQILHDMGVDYRVVVGPGYRFEPQPLPIYHVQGYLPREEGTHPVFGEPVELVFSEENYHSQYLHPYSWSNLTQLHLLQEHTGLFVGLSMTDPNLRRLLEVSYEQDRHHLHYAVTPSYRAEAASHSHADAETLRQLEHSRLAQALRELEEKVAQSLGLRLLWVDRYEDIPKLLARLR